MTISCLKESKPSLNDSDQDDTNLELPKLLSTINVCRYFISAKCCSEKL